VKGYVLKSLGLVAVVTAVMLVVVVFAASASAKVPDAGDGPTKTLCPPPSDGSKQKEWCALDRVDRFQETLTGAGFGVQEGKFAFWDLVKDTCEGKVRDALANNPWPNAYISMYFEPHEGAPTPPIDVLWQLREDEAIVLVGQTPPAAAFFSYQSFVAFPPGARGRIGAPVGDTINIGTIHTIGPDRVNRPVIIIITGHRETERRVRAAARAAGYPDSIINVETISPVIAPLGVSRDGEEASWLGFVHRVAVPEDKKALEEYIRNPPYKLFRVTPVDPATGEVGTEAVFDPDPEPVPVLRVRGTGHTEMALYPALKRLRAAILEVHGADGKCEGECKELDTHIWTGVTREDNRELVIEKPYVGLQRGVQLLGAGRDTNYLATYPNFMLREGFDEYVIAYGVNHQATGKVTYSSVSIYADQDRWIGPKDGTFLSPAFEGSAERYLPGDPDAQYLYAIKVARHCDDADKPYCMEVKQPDFLDKNGVAYSCVLGDFLTRENPHTWDLNEQEMFFLFRSYMEPKTNVSPDDNELLYDRAIYFGPYDFAPE
jgi:hypothetical protein